LADAVDLEVKEEMKAKEDFYKDDDLKKSINSL
jgi:hypothetical protein